MPAIQIARLRVQMVELMASCDQPAQFLRALHDLLDFYNDRTYRAGQAGNVLPLGPHYRVPRPVLRQVEIELVGWSDINPAAALNLADTLWMDLFLEPRLLGVHLLSLAPVTPPEPVLERITAWARPEEDRQVLDALITRGTRRLSREQPDCWATLIKNWLTSENQVVESMGARALISVIEDEGFQNLPSIFRLISPLMQTVPANMHGDLLTVMEALARRSPSETAYFVRQLITLAASPDIPRLIRRCLPYFPTDIQANLRLALKTRG